MKSNNMSDISRVNGMVMSEPSFVPSDGVVFLKCTWSESILYLRYLLGILEEFPQLNLYVIDIDLSSYSTFREQYQVTSHGKGETFWIFKGSIVEMVNDYPSQKQNVLNYSRELSKLCNENGK